MFIFFFRIPCNLWDNVTKCGTARQATDDSIMRCRINAICMPDNEGKDTDIHSQYLILPVSYLINSFSSRKMLYDNTNTEKLRSLR